MIDIQPRYIRHDEENQPLYDCGEKEDRSTYLLQRATPMRLRVQHGIVVFEVTEIRPHSSCVVTINPVCRFKGTRLAVEHEIAPWFGISGFRVGHTECVLMSNGHVPATMFPPLPNKLSKEERELFKKLMSLTWNTCTPAMTIRLHVHNLDYRPHPFKATLFGVCTF